MKLQQSPLRAANHHLVQALRELDRSNCSADIKIAESLERLLARVEARITELEVQVQQAAA